MISLNLFNNTTLTDLETDITKYVNENVKCIVRVLLDFLEDDNEFTAEDFLPYNNLRIDNSSWNKMVNDLYDIIQSIAIRYHIKPKYEFLLYQILRWWEDCTDNSDDLLLNKIDSNLVARIQNTCTSIYDDNYVLNAITNFDEYFYILFADHDFLPENLERLLTIYLRKPESFKKLFPYLDLGEYRDLMPNDLRERYDELDYGAGKLTNNDFVESNLFDHILWCSEKLQQNVVYRESIEDNRNDFIRDLLDAKGYTLRDQNRRGMSSSGKQSGEVDILILKDDFPLSIIEALNLSCVDKTYISKHIDKTYKYDTLGNEFNFIISYVKVPNFLTFWKKYLSFTESYKYPFELSNFIVPSSKQYSELKWAVAELKRNDIITRLYHIVIHIP